jgi:alginate O-acetyltransferase complex protein AlgI
LLVVMFAWVLFRADTLSYAIDYWKELFDFETSPEQLSMFINNLDRELLVALLIAIAGSFGLFNWFYVKIQTLLAYPNRSAIAFAYGYHLISVVVYAGVLALCTLYLVAGTYNPFIYYRF